MSDAPFLGVLMLQTRFPRPLGDVGNPASFGMSVRHRIVIGATPQRDVVDAPRRLVAQHLEVDAIVLECTNLPPYADAIARAAGRPVHHLLTLVDERWPALAPA